MQRKTSKSNKKQPNAVQNLSRKKTTKTPRTSKNRKSRAKFECSSELAELIRLANLVKEKEKFDFEGYAQSHIKKGNALLGYEILRFDAIYTFYESLPEKVRSEIIIGDERTKYKKDDSYEFWINNDGYAQDMLLDLNSDDQISDEEYEKIINDGADAVASVLIEYGYYGDKYSYQKYLEKKREDSDNYDSYDDVTVSNEWFYPMLRALNRLNNTRDFLLSIVNLSNHFQEISSLNKEESFYKRQQRNQMGKIVFEDEKVKLLKNNVLATTITVNEDGTVNFSVSEWAKILQGVDITRIRLCEVCEDIFWAKRKDAFACSPKHSKVRQMRLLRKNWEEKGELYLNARKRKK